MKWLAANLCIAVGAGCRFSPGCLERWDSRKLTGHKETASYSTRSGDKETATKQNLTAYGRVTLLGIWAVQAVLILLRLALLGLSTCRAIKAMAATWTISRRAYAATSDQPKPKPPSNTPMLLVTAHVRGQRASRFPPATLNSRPKRLLTTRATRPQSAGTCRGGRPRSTTPRARYPG
jgi:hypothetical protein